MGREADRGTSIEGRIFRVDRRATVRGCSRRVREKVDVSGRATEWGCFLRRFVDAIRCGRTSDGGLTGRQDSSWRTQREGAARFFFLRRGNADTDVPRRLYHTYFYTEYFNNDICKSGSRPRATGHALNHTVCTHESLYTFPFTFSTIGSSAATSARLLYAR